MPVPVVAVVEQLVQAQVALLLRVLVVAVEAVEPLPRVQTLLVQVVALQQETLLLQPLLLCRQAL